MLVYSLNTKCSSQTVTIHKLREFMFDIKFETSRALYAKNYILTLEVIVCKKTQLLSHANKKMIYIPFNRFDCTCFVKCYTTLRTIYISFINSILKAIFIFNCLKIKGKV